MKIIPAFETDRVKARRVTQGDLEELVSMYHKPEVMKTLGGVRSREQALDGLARMIKHWDDHGFGVWILEDKESGTFMGRAGLFNVHIDGADEIELMYGLLPEYWSKGIATEVAQEIIRIGFQELGLENITCFSLHENKASQRIMEKLGFTYEKNCVHADLPHVFYRLTKEQWEEKE